MKTTEQLELEIQVFRQEVEETIASVFETLQILMKGNEKALKLIDVALVDLHSRVEKLEKPNKIRDRNEEGKEL